MWFPHPAQVTLPHVSHVIGLHTIFYPRIVEQRSLALSGRWHDPHTAETLEFRASRQRRADRIQTMLLCRIFGTLLSDTCFLLSLIFDYVKSGCRCSGIDTATVG